MLNNGKRHMGGSITVQTQCCLAKLEDDCEDSKGEGLFMPEGQLVVEPLHWNAPLLPPAMLRSLGEASTIVPRGK